MLTTRHYLLAAAALAALTVPARGDNETTDVCDASAVREGVALRLGRSLTDHELDTLQIENQGGALHATFVTATGDERALTASTCDELAAAISLITGRVTPVVVATVEATPAPAAPETVPEPAAPSSPAPIVHPPRRWGASVRSAVLGGTGILPGTSLGGEIAIALAHDQIFAEVGYAGWRTTPASADGVDTLNVGLWTVDVRLGWRGHRLPLAAWVVGELGQTSATDRGPIASGTVASRYAAVGAGIGARWRPRPWIEGIVAVEVLDALERPRFEMDASTPLFEPAVIASVVSLGISVAYQ